MLTEQTLTKRTTQKKKTRERLIRETTALFGRHGLSATRTADVASQAGLSHGGVFVHFRNRDELVGAVLARLGQQITDRLHALISRDASLRQVLEAHLQCIAGSERTYAAFLRESRALPKDLLRSWVGIQSAVSTHLAEAAKRERRRGQLRSMRQHLLFSTWIGLVHHYVMNRDLFAPGSAVLRVKGEELVEHFLSLIERRDR